MTFAQRLANEILDEAKRRHGLKECHPDLVAAIYGIGMDLDLELLKLMSGLREAERTTCKLEDQNV